MTPTRAPGLARTNDDQSLAGREPDVTVVEGDGLADAQTSVERDEGQNPVARAETTLGGAQPTRGLSWCQLRESGAVRAGRASPPSARRHRPGGRRPWPPRVPDAWRVTCRWRHPRGASRAATCDRTRGPDRLALGFEADAEVALILSGDADVAHHPNRAAPFLGRSFPAVPLVPLHRVAGRPRQCPRRWGRGGHRMSAAAWTACRAASRENLIRFRDSDTDQYKRRAKHCLRNTQPHQSTTRSANPTDRSGDEGDARRHERK